MGRHVVEGAADLEDGRGLVVEVEGQSIGVFRVHGEFFALRNRCPHQGGPVCEGALFPRHSARVLSRGKVKEFLDYEQMVVACPWHGWEFDLRSGTCLADPKRGITPFELQVEDGQVVLILAELGAGQAPDASQS